MIRKLVAPLVLADIYTIIILSIYSILALIFIGSIDNSTLIILMNSAIISGILVLARMSEKYPDSKGIIIARKLYVVPLVLLIYSQVQVYIAVINPVDYDAMLIEWDYSIFGINPTEAMRSIASPALTEYLQISYMTYFLMPVIIGIELHRRGDAAEFDRFSRQILMGFYLSYMLYFFYPAIGPRFTIHDFNMISAELPGLWLTEFLREIVNSGGGITNSVGNPADLVNRDCMPSGHTMNTLINMTLAFQLRSRYKYVFLLFGTSLIFATIYMGYHYVVDVIAGIAFAIVVLVTEPFVNRLWHWLKR